MSREVRACAVYVLCVAFSDDDVDCFCPQGCGRQIDVCSTVSSAVWRFALSSLTHACPAARQSAHHLISSHLISSHLISSHLISSHLISSHLISSHLISSHLISSHLISSHLISSHLISSHLISSHLISSHLISSHLISSHLIVDTKACPAYCFQVSGMSSSSRMF